MSDRKRRVIRLLENYINDFQGESVQEMYGKGSHIKIHEVMYSTGAKSVLIEAVVVLGDVINENTMDRRLADVLIQDAIVYFYPEHSVKAYVRFDV